MISVLIVMECYAGLKYQSFFFFLLSRCVIIPLNVAVYSDHVQSFLFVYSFIPVISFFYTSHACHVLDQQCQVGGCHKYCSFILAFRLDLPYLFHNCELLTFALGMLFELFVK